MKRSINLFFCILYTLSLYKYVFIDFIAFLNNTLIADLLIDTLLLVIFLNSLKFCPKNLKKLNLCILIFAVIGCIYNKTNLITFLNGIREIMIIPTGICFIYSIISTNQTSYFLKLFRKFAYIFLLIQIPCTAIQFLTYGAGDYVGGTLGFGGSGVLTLSIFILTFFLINYKVKVQKAGKVYCTFIHLPLLLPILFNETKISFIIIPLFMICALEIKNVKSLIAMGVLSITTIAFYSSFYSNQGRSYDNPINTIFNKDYLNYYLAGNAQDYDDVPRFTKLSLGLSIVSNDLGNLLFGIEYGAFKGSSFLGKSEFANKYNWLLIGSRPYLFYLFITGGLSLVCYVILVIKISLNFHLNTIKLNNYQKIFLAGIVGIIFFYNDAFRERFFIAIFFSTIVALITMNYYSLYFEKNSLLKKYAK
ncbi:hypothetical protein NF867_12470 [Solitalea sp. MAHUQ-68]|uniref:Uncharacterized protein n=1 Tax=Solitalea agri TaxID=2953739 RepID=A0A9X2JDJ2_9SPHI|nr:hypothetical protein [Solitalea agri]MCO4293679.1 hypothetical protein [Solitalea agri]